MDELLLIWIAAIESGFAHPDDWVAWADRQIERMDKPPAWILDLSLVHTADPALEVLWPATDKVARIIWDQLDWKGLCLGFLYLCFERGDLTLLELRMQAGDQADCASFRIDCEEFYLLANEITGAGPTLPASRPLIERVSELFKPLADLARQRWSQTTKDSA